jgi:hypothetical protein
MVANHKLSAREHPLSNSLGRKMSYFVADAATLAADLGAEGMEIMALSSSTECISSAAVAPSSGEIPSSDKTKRISSILTPDHSPFTNLMSHSNLKALISSLFAMALSYVLHVSLLLISSKTGLDVLSGSAFVGMLLFLVVCLLTRWQDPVFKKHFLLAMFPSAILATVVILCAAGGDTGNATIPLVALMVNVQAWSRWMLTPKEERKNVVIQFLKCTPVALVFTIIGFLPPLAVAIPGRLLTKHPKSYALYCGLGFPALAFFLRKGALAYFVRMVMQLVASGDMQPQAVVPFLSTVTFCISTCLTYANVVLLYMSENEIYAVYGSVASIFTETAGKLYAVWATWRAMKSYLEAVHRKEKGTLSQIVYRAQAEAGVRSAVSGLRREKNEGNGESEENEDAADEKSTLEYWLDILTMFAVRWYNEIVSEKSCLIVAAFVTKVIMNIKRSGVLHTKLAIVFFVTELIADAVLVYSLDECCGVPFRRLPPPPTVWTKDYWFDILITGVMLSSGAFGFNFAYGSTLKWFPDAADVVAGAAAALVSNATNAAAP